MGGPTNIIDRPNDYYSSAQLLYNLTLAVNRASDYLPLWGTCLGFQLLGEWPAKVQSYINFIIYSDNDIQQLHSDGGYTVLFN